MTSGNDPYERYGLDAGVLARIGSALSGQPTGLRVRIPRELADLAREAWERIEGEDGPLGAESHEQRIVRHRAGTLALIGLCVETTGVLDGDDVVVDADAWFVGDALGAADDAGLLVGMVSADPVLSEQLTSSKTPIQLFAVVEIDLNFPTEASVQVAGNGEMSSRVTVKEVLPSVEEAQREVRRLNEFKQNKGCTYFWQSTRYYPGGR